MQISFETSLKSMFYILSGISILGTLFDAYTNSKNLITCQIAIILSIFILLLWFFIVKWIKYKKPAWGKVKITKPNFKVNSIFVNF